MGNKRVGRYPYGSRAVKNCDNIVAHQQMKALTVAIDNSHC